MALKKLHTSLVVLGLAGAALAAYWLQNRSVGRGDVAGAVSSTGGSLPVAGATGTTGPANKGRTGRDGPAAVEVALVQATTLLDETQAVGTLRSRQGVMLRPEVSGRVVQLGFRDGQAVRRGQMLVQFDDALQKAQLQQAQAQANIARTNLQRNRELQAQNFVSQSAVDQVQASLQVAEAQVALALAQVQRMRIDAPFAGVLGIGQVNVGDYVKDGGDLVNLEDLSQAVVDFRLPEGVLGRLKLDQLVTVAVDALPGRSFKAKVQALDSQVDANGRSVLVRALLANPGGELRPGMFARANIVFARREGALVVPEEALVPQGGKQFIIKLLDAPTAAATADGAASGVADDRPSRSGKVSQRIEAKLGLRLPGKVEILQGLSVGDLVVTAGQARLMRSDGLPVKVVELNQDGARPGAAASAAASGAGPSSSAALPRSGP